MKKAPIRLCLVGILTLVAFLSGFYVGRASASHSTTMTLLAPSAAEVIRPSSPASPTDSPAESRQETSVFPININTATAQELTALPGIGDVLASRIVEYRRENGSFTDITQITQVSGIGERKLEAIRELICIE